MRWLKLVAAVGLVAVIAAAFAVAFRSTLALVVERLGGSDVVAMIDALPWWQRIALPALGGLGAGLLALWMARLRAGSGVGFVMEAIVLGTARIPLARSMVQAVASWLAIVTGNSLGREGPLIQFGAAAGEGARRWMRLDDTAARLPRSPRVAPRVPPPRHAPLPPPPFLLPLLP